MTTYLDLIESAVATSAKNRQGAIATDGPELLNVAYRAFQQLYAHAARVNPFYFGKTAVVAMMAGAWARPADAELVFRIEDPGANEIVVVPLDDRAADRSRGAVYRLGRAYYPASAVAPDPQAGDLTFYYSASPAVPASVNDALPADWPEPHNGLVILALALYLATKDGRAEEVGSLTAQLTGVGTTFTNFLEHETANEVRRFGTGRLFVVPSLVPLFTLLAGGAPPPQG